MRFSAGGTSEVFQSQRAQGCWLGWAWGVMGRGGLVWRQMVWEGCPWAPASDLRRADGVWGGSWWLPRREGSGRGMLGHSLGLFEVIREGRRGCREAECGIFLV